MMKLLCFNILFCIGVACTPEPADWGDIERAYAERDGRRVHLSYSVRQRLFNDIRAEQAGRDAAAPARLPTTGGRPARRTDLDLLGDRVLVHVL